VIKSNTNSKKERNMAAMFITKNALFRFSKSFPNVPSISLPKPSRVFFASASNHSDVSLLSPYFNSLI
jgi:hypothetical protein